MQFLNSNLNENEISSVFDRCYRFPSFYEELCKEGLKIDNPVAYCKYSVFLIFNIQDPTNSNYLKAKQYLEKSIQKGYTMSYFLLARLMYNIFKKNDEAYKLAQEGTDKGNNYSKCLLGYFVFKGIGVQKDQKKGLSLMLESGAEDYYKKFSTEIALYFLRVVGDNEQAFKWFEKAFNLSKTKASINNYALCFLNGIGVIKNIEKAKEIFKIGADQGDSNCKYHLNFILEEEKKK